MTLRPFSDHDRGLFISVDGPSGAGKSTIVQHLAQLLVATGETVHVTAEPSTGPIGALAREPTETVTGHALACLYAADRYHHIETEIRPKLEDGTTVIADRYIPSGLVVQRFDGIDPAFLWQLNAEADRPDLAVILEADPAVIAQRLKERGPHNRFQLRPAAPTPKSTSTSKPPNGSSKPVSMCCAWTAPKPRTTPPHTSWTAL
jgi:dTMP kinase